MENKEKVVKGDKVSTPKQQKVSASYTIRALGENINKLNGLGLMNNEEVEIMKKIHTAVATKYMQKELGV